MAAAAELIEPGVVGHLVGLVSRPDLNGCEAEARSYTPAAGRYTVTVTRVQAAARIVCGGGAGEPDEAPEEMRVKPENFRLPDGTAVRVIGLQSAPELNGSTGVVQRYNEAKDRYSTLLGAQKEKLTGLRPANCIATGPYHAPPAGTDAEAPWDNDATIMASCQGAPPSATCFFCLEGPPPEPSPDVRRAGVQKSALSRCCACRGDSAGYAHIGCQVQAALETGNSSHWTHCMICKQAYGGGVQYCMGKALFNMVKDHPAEHPARRAAGLIHASGLRTVGRFQECVTMLRHVRRTLVETVGLEHPDTQGSGVNLMNALSDLEQYEEAVQVGEVTLASQKRVLGPDDPTALNCAQCLAGAIEDRDRQRGLAAGSNVAAAAAATSTLSRNEECHANSLRALGPENSGTLRSALNLAKCMANCGKLEEALRVAEQAAETCYRVMGADHSLSKRFRALVENLS